MIRIVQEALTNVRKHAEAGRVRLAAWEAGQDTLIEVTDNGRGFGPSDVAAARFGLRGMRERAESDRRGVPGRQLSEWRDNRPVASPSVRGSESMKPIRLFVVDDHILFRRGLIGLLSDMKEFEVVGEAGNGEEALRMIPKASPDIVLLDINMPGLSGVETLRAMREAGQKMNVLMLTISQDENDLVGAIMAGASGYLLKNAEPEMLRRTLLDVAAGKSVLSPEITAQVFKVMRRTQSAHSHDLVSGRELEVLRCLSRGLTTSQIATELFISENTVKTHIRHILEKMEVNNRAEGGGQGIAAGLV